MTAGIPTKLKDHVISLVDDINGLVQSVKSDMKGFLSGQVNLIYSSSL